ncbi:MULTISPECIES: hypothetical protein [Bacillus]|uniref:hypothetical protein n=1 Tax=Bacillus TaxID=1386 RepID=UPI00301AA6D5
MKINVLSIQSIPDQTVIGRENRYKTELALQTSVLGQQKEFKDQFVLPTGLATKVDAIFKEIQEYIDSMNAAEDITVFLDSYFDSDRFVVDVHKDNQKLESVNFNLRTSQTPEKLDVHAVLWTTMNAIKKAVGWNENTDQKLIIEIDSTGKGAWLGDLFKNIGHSNVSVKIVNGVMD